MTYLADQRGQHTWLAAALGVAILAGVTMVEAAARPGGGGPPALSLAALAAPTAGELAGEAESGHPDGTFRDVPTPVVDSWWRLPGATGGASQAPELPPPDPPPGGGQPNEPAPGSYSGGFAGQTAIVVNHPVLSRLDPREVHTRDVRNDLAGAWTEVRWLVERGLTHNLETMPPAELPGGVRRLYEVEVDLADVSAGTDRLTLTVHPDHQTFTLFYVIPDHRMRFKADVVFLSNPTITVDFGLAVELTYVTYGRPAAAGSDPVHVNGPVWLSSAKLRLMHPDAAVNKKPDLSVAEFFKGSVAQSVERAMAGRTEDIAILANVFTADLALVLADLEEQGLDTSIVTPWYDDGSYRLLLRLGHRGLVHEPQVVLGK